MVELLECQLFSNFICRRRNVCLQTFYRCLPKIPLRYCCKGFCGFIVSTSRIRGIEGFKLKFSRISISNKGFIFDANEKWTTRNHTSKQNNNNLKDVHKQDSPSLISPKIEYWSTVKLSNLINDGKNDHLHVRTFRDMANYRYVPSKIMTLKSTLLFKTVDWLTIYYWPEFGTVKCKNKYLFKPLKNILRRPYYYAGIKICGI